MPLFFRLKRPIEATVDIVALTGTVGYLTYIWSQVDTVAAWCIAPYLGWLSFATYLSVRCEPLTPCSRKPANPVLPGWYWIPQQLELYGQRDRCPRRSWIRT